MGLALEAELPALVLVLFGEGGRVRRRPRALLSGFKYRTCRPSALHTFLCLLILNAELNTFYSNLILCHFHHLHLRA